MDNPTNLNSTGHCITHPQIRVRRPNANGSWRIILTNGCPLCAVDSSGCSSSPSKPSPRRGSSKAMLIRQNSEECDLGKSLCSVSDHTEVTETTAASSQSSSSCPEVTCSPLSPVESLSSRSRHSVSSRTGGGSQQEKLHQENVESRRRLSVEEDAQIKSTVQQIRRHLSRGRSCRDSTTSESISRSCRFADEEQISSRHPSRPRRASMEQRCRFADEGRHLSRPRRPSQEQHPQLQRSNTTSSRSTSRCNSTRNRDSVRSQSRSLRFEDEDANSIGDGSYDERTVGTYSARESKSSLPKRSSNIGASECQKADRQERLSKPQTEQRRMRRSFVEVKR